MGALLLALAIVAAIIGVILLVISRGRSLEAWAIELLALIYVIPATAAAAG